MILTEQSQDRFEYLLVGGFSPYKTVVVERNIYRDVLMKHDTVELHRQDFHILKTEFIYEDIFNEVKFYFRASQSRLK